MAVAFVRSHTDVSIKTAGTNNLGVNISTATTVGNVLVACIIMDNAATVGAPIVSSIAVPAGETASWVLLGRATHPSSTTAGAFAQGEMWAIRTSVVWPVASYTMTLSSSVTMKATQVSEYSGALAAMRSTTGTAYSTTTTSAQATATGTVPVVGDLALGFAFFSNAATNTYTVTGSPWDIGDPPTFGSTGGNAATNNCGDAAYDVVATTALPSFGRSTTSIAGNGAIVAVLQQYVPPSITQAAYRFYADGTETASTSLAAQNTGYTADVTAGDVNLQLRVLMQNTSAIAGDPRDDYRLQWEKNASGPWDSVVSPYALIDGYAASNRDTNGQISNATTTKSAQSFVSAASEPLIMARFFMSRNGTPPTTVTAELYAHTGTFGTASGLPTGSPLAISTTVITAASVRPFGEGHVWVDFAFDGSFNLVGGTPYCIVVTASGVESAINCYLVGADTSAHTHAGNNALFFSGVWNYNNADLIFGVYTTEIATDTVLPYDSPNLTDTAATTNRLTGGTGSFVAGKVSEDGLADDLALTANNYTELLYSVTLKKADLADGDSLRFRVLCNGAVTGITYTQYPTISITKTPVAITQAAYRFYADGTESGSTALAAQDTVSSVDISNGDVNLQLRTRLQSTNVASIDSTDDLQLQWEKNASGLWSDVSVGAPVEVLAAEYDVGGSGVHEYANAVRRISAQSFLGNGQFLTKTEFPLGCLTAGTPGNSTSVLYPHTGTFNTGSSKGVGTTPLAASINSVANAALPSTPGAWSTFFFDGSFFLESGIPYCIGMKTDINPPAHALIIWSEIAGTYPSRATFYQSDGYWYSTDVHDAQFRVYTQALDGVRSFQSPNLTDGAATTNLLTGGTGSFTAGEVSETGLVTDLGWAGNNYTELLYSLTLKQANFTDGDTLRFRVLRNGATSGLTYTQYPTITIGSGTVTGRPKVWTGSAWETKPAKVYVGGTWTEKPMKVWNGSVWEPIGGAS